MSHHWGYVGATASAVLFGMTAALNKAVLANVHPLVVAGMVYFIAGVVLLAVRASPLKARILAMLETPTATEAHMSRRDYWILALVILSGAVLAPLLFMHGLAGTSAVNTSLLLNAESLFTVAIAFAFLGERALGKDYVGIAIVIAGAVVVTTNADLGGVELAKGTVGNLMVVAACLFWGIDNNLSRLISKKRDLILISALKGFIGGGMLLAAAALLGLDLSVPLSSLPYLLVVGTFGIGFSILLFLFALRELGAMKTGAVFSTSSLFGAFFAFALLGESFTVVQLLAGTAMFLGVLIIYAKKPPSIR